MFRHSTYQEIERLKKEITRWQAELFSKCKLIEELRRQQNKIEWELGKEIYKLRFELSREKNRDKDFIGELNSLNIDIFKLKEKTNARFRNCHFISEECPVPAYMDCLGDICKRFKPKVYFHRRKDDVVHFKSLHIRNKEV